MLLLILSCMVLFMVSTIHGLNKTCQGTNVCNQDTFNCTTTDQDCYLDCDGELSCSSVDLFATYSSTHKLYVYCHGKQACRSLDIESERETIITCGDKDNPQDNTNSDCYITKVLLSNLPPNSTSKITCDSQYSCRRTVFYCLDGDPTSSCEYIVNAGLYRQTGNQVNRFYCEGQVASLSEPNNTRGHCRVSCPLEAVDSSDDACDTLASDVWYQQLYLHCKDTRTNCINEGGDRETNFAFRATVSPTTDPTERPTLQPTTPTVQPSDYPVQPPTAAPTISPTLPTSSPSTAPTQPPTSAPTAAPTLPSMSPTDLPSFAPTIAPTDAPNAVPTDAPNLDQSTTESIGSISTTQTSESPTVDGGGEPTKKPTGDESNNRNSEVRIFGQWIKLYWLVFIGIGLCVFCSICALITLWFIRRDSQKNQLGFTQREVQQQTNPKSTKTISNPRVTSTSHLGPQTTQLKGDGYSNSAASNDPNPNPPNNNPNLHPNGRQRLATGSGTITTEIIRDDNNNNNNQQETHHTQQTSNEVQAGVASKHLKLKKKKKKHITRDNTGTFYTEDDDINGELSPNKNMYKSKRKKKPGHSPQDSNVNEDDISEDDEDPNDEDNTDDESDSEDENSSEEEDDDDDEDDDEDSGDRDEDDETTGVGTNTQLENMYNSAQVASKKLERELIKKQQQEIENQRRLLHEQQRQMNNNININNGQGNSQDGSAHHVHTHSKNSQQSLHLPSQIIAQNQPYQMQNAMNQVAMGQSMQNVQNMGYIGGQGIEMGYYGNSRPMTPNSMHSGQMQQIPQPMQQIPQPIAMPHQFQPSPHQSPRFANNVNVNGNGMIPTTGQLSKQPSAKSIPQPQAGLLHPSQMSQVSQNAPSITPNGPNYYEMVHGHTPTISPVTNVTSPNGLEYTSNMVPMNNMNNMNNMTNMTNVTSPHSQYMQMVTHSPNTINNSRPTTPNHQQFYQHPNVITQQQQQQQLPNNGMIPVPDQSPMAYPAQSPHIIEPNNGGGGGGGYHIVDDSKMELPDVGIDEAGHLKSQNSLNTPDLPDVSNLLPSREPDMDDINEDDENDVSVSDN